jgi:hypothetical protein
MKNNYPKMKTNKKHSMKTITKIHYYFLISFLLTSMSFIMEGQITFQKYYPSSFDQEGLDAIPTIDGGYIIAGMTTTNILNDMDIYVVKTNNMGIVQWSKKYGGIKPEYAWSILENSDSSFFVLGFSQSFGGGDYDTYLIKIKSTGDTLWTKTYGTNGNESGKEIIPTSDGNYIIVGEGNDQVSSNYDAFLIKIDPSGNVIWTKNYGGPAYESGNSVKQCLDGGFILTGQTYSYGQNGDVYLVKTNSVGDTLWTKNYGGAQYDEGMSLIANSDGSFTFVVRDSSSGFGDVDVQIIKTDSNGSIIWNKIYGGSQKDTGKMIQPTSDGGYIVAGHSRSFGWVNPDMWILRLDQSGDTLWTRHYGGSDHEHCYSARQTSDGGFTAIGHTASNSSNWEIMFIKLNSIGKFGQEVGVNEIYSDNNLSVYPNPTERIINIDITGNMLSSIFKITNTLGQEIFSETIDGSNQNKKKTIDLYGHESGVYILSIQSSQESITKKIILQ